MVIQAGASLDGPLRLYWIRAVEQVWEIYYDIDEEDEVPFALGLILMALGQPREALCYFRYSLDLHGPAAAAFYYFAECLRQLGQVPEAVAYLDRGLDLEPEDGPLRALRVKLLAESVAESMLTDPDHAEPPPRNGEEWTGIAYLNEWKGEWTGIAYLELSRKSWWVC